MTTFTFATAGVQTPILISAHAAYSASRTLVNAGIDQVVPLVVRRPDTPTQHDITALFPSYATADAFATALRSEGQCAASMDLPDGDQIEFTGISSSQVRVQNTPGVPATEVQFTLTEVPA
jgi:hypothetical protein